MEVVLIRHTSVAISSSICYGKSNVNLAETFEEESKLICTKFQFQIEFDEVFSSPLDRCVELANCFSLNPRIDERLIELDFGDWEMKPWNEIPSDELTTWMNNFVSESPKNGENFLALVKRSNLFWDELRNTNLKRVAVVSHAGFIRASLNYFLKIPLDSVFKLDIPFGNVTIIQMNNEPKFDKIVRFNV